MVHVPSKNFGHLVMKWLLNSSQKTTSSEELGALGSGANKGAPDAMADRPRFGRWSPMVGIKKNQLRCVVKICSIIRHFVKHAWLLEAHLGSGQSPAWKRRMFHVSRRRDGCTAAKDMPFMVVLHWNTSDILKLMNIITILLNYRISPTASTTSITSWQKDCSVSLSRQALTLYITSTCPWHLAPRHDTDTSASTDGQRAHSSSCRLQGHMTCHGPSKC